MQLAAPEVLDLSNEPGDGVDALQAPLWQPHGVCIGPGGSLVISDTINHRVRKLVPVLSGE